MDSNLLEALEERQQRGDAIGASAVLDRVETQLNGEKTFRLSQSNSRTMWASRMPGPVVALSVAAIVLIVGLASAALFRSGLVTTDEPSAGEVRATLPSAQQTVTTAAVVSEAQDETVIVASESRVKWASFDAGASHEEGGISGIGVGDGRVVVVGSTDEIWYSDDLVVWTSGPVELAFEDDWSDPAAIDIVAYGPRGWVAAGTNVFGRDVAFWYSEDATEWTLGEINSPPVSSSGWVVRNIMAGGPGWVAVGNHQRDGRIWVSTDGVSWEIIALPEFAEVWFHSVSVDEGVLTVIGRPQDGPHDTVAAPGDDVVALRWVSEDGFSWTPLPFQEDPVGPETHTISVNPDTGEQVALNRYSVWVSNDGVEWVQVASSNGIPPYTHPSQEVVWVGDTMVGGSRDVIFESSDGGATWVRTGPTDLEFVRLYSFDGKVIALVWMDVLIGTLE